MLGQAIPNYCERLRVRPGLMGLGQMEIPLESSLEDVRRKVACDLYYIRHMSGLLDTKLAVASAFAMLLPYRIVRYMLRLPRIEMIESDFPETTNEFDEAEIEELDQFVRTESSRIPEVVGAEW